MKIRVIGAAGGEVTGSCCVVETGRGRVMVDCGMFQGGKKAEAKNRPASRPKGRLDAVLVTHGHLDHSGRLPLLVKYGYRRPVYATPGTAEMSALIIRDSARLQAAEAERMNRKRERAGQDPVEPLYGPEEAEAVIDLFRPVPYGEPVEVAPGFRAVFHEAGHMLGSSSILLIAEDGGETKRIVFSGDLGPLTDPLLKSFEPFPEADTVFIESTYGSRDHRPLLETVEEFVGIVKECVEARGKILVPTFAVGRAQLLVALMGWMFRKGRVKPFPLFLDSPMAIEATNIFVKHPELYDENLTRFIQQRPLREDLKTLTLCGTAEESKKINDVPGPCLVMAGAGMCTGGRILHHFKQNLWRPGCHVVFVGYQAAGSLGRMIVEGAEEIRLFGERIVVKAKVHTLGGFSAHAGQKDLLKWIEAIAPSRPRIVVNHGEDEGREALAREIRRRYRLASTLPAQGDVIEV